MLWWEIFRIMRAKTPSLVLLENVDRLLNSPAGQRGRDFAIMLAGFSSLGYTVEWRMVAADDYGFPQRRRRVYIVGKRDLALDAEGLWDCLTKSGTLARALPIQEPGHMSPGCFRLPNHHALPPPEEREAFEAAAREWLFRVGTWDQLSGKHSPFQNAGVMSDGLVLTTKVHPAPHAFLNRRPSGGKKPRLLGQVVARTKVVPVEYLVPQEQKSVWESHKGAKSLERSKGYCYSEGGMSCPDDRGRASRTIITSEGGRSPSRFKHIVAIEPDDKIQYIERAPGDRIAYRSFIDSSGDSTVRRTIPQCGAG